MSFCGCVPVIMGSPLRFSLCASHVILVIVTFLLFHILLSLRSYQCLHANVSSFSFASSAVGPPQGLAEGLRHEAAQ